jgi:hypothetical protein
MKLGFCLFVFVFLGFLLRFLGLNSVLYHLSHTPSPV